MRPHREPLQGSALSHQHRAQLGIRFARSSARRGHPRPRPPEQNHRPQRGPGIRHRRAGRHAAAALPAVARARVEAVDGRYRLEPRVQHHRQHPGARLRAHADGRTREPRLWLRSRSRFRRAHRDRLRQVWQPSHGVGLALGRWPVARRPLRPIELRHRHANDDLADARAGTLLRVFLPVGKRSRDTCRRPAAAAPGRYASQRRAHRQRLQDSFEQRSVSLE